MSWDEGKSSAPTSQTFAHCSFGKLEVNLNGLVVKVLDSQSRSPVFKTIGWLILRKGAPAPHSLTRLAPLFKIFVSLPSSFLFHPLLRYCRQFSPPSHNPLPP